MSVVIDEAICLRHWDWSETSQTAAVFTRQRGVVRVLAKGSKRPKAPYSGGVELLSRAEVGLILRPNSELALLTYWDLKQSYPALRSVLSVHNTGLYMADLVFNFVRDHDPHTELYDAMTVALGAMRTAEDAPRMLLRFQWTLLDQAGFRPQLEGDVRTGELLAEASEYLFNATLGGLTASAGSPEIGVWRVRAETVRLLRGIAESGSGVVIPADTAAVDRANRLLASYARHVLGSEPPTMAVLFGDRLAQ